MAPQSLALAKRTAMLARNPSLVANGLGDGDFVKILIIEEALAFQPETVVIRLDLVAMTGERVGHIGDPADARDAEGISKGAQQGKQQILWTQSVTLFGQAPHRVESQPGDWALQTADQDGAASIGDAEDHGR